MLAAAGVASTVGICCENSEEKSLNAEIHKHFKAIIVEIKTGESTVTVVRAVFGVWLPPCWPRTALLSLLMTGPFKIKDKSLHD